jgi:hypothetical protein
MTFEEWYAYGRTQRWCSEIICTTHDILPMSRRELDDWEIGSDNCLYAVRMYESEDQFDDAELI